jgi:hypothetical protein
MQYRSPLLALFFHLFFQENGHLYGFQEKSPNQLMAGLKRILTG